MTISEILQAKLEESGISKRQAVVMLGTTRPTLDAWLSGQYVPDPWTHAAAIAEFTGDDEAYILAVLLQQKGIRPGLFGRLATFAKGVYLSSKASPATT